MHGCDLIFYILGVIRERMEASHAERIHQIIEIQLLIREQLSLL